MGIIDYLYFKFVALRKLKKAYDGDVVHIRIKPDLQVIKDIGGKWLFDDAYKMSVKIGEYDYKVSSHSLKGLLKELADLARNV